MRLKLITVPDNRLRQKSEPLANFTKTDAKFVENLAETLLKKDDPPGVGLSAVQVAVHKRIFVVYLPPVFDLRQTNSHTPPSEIKVFINPEIIDHSDSKTLGDDKEQPAMEGCLSVPALYGPVLRYDSVTVKYQTMTKLDSPTLIERTDTFSHFYARVIQHEYDHLEGILFTDYIKKSHNKLYFDNGDSLVDIPNPEQLAVW